MMRMIKDLTGQRFGMLTVIKRVRKEGNRKPYWLCRCDCGREKVVYQYNLIHGNTKSCGCAKRPRKKPVKAKSGSICWECKRCAGRCPWTKCGHPVIGWKAEKEDKYPTHYGKGGFTTSYTVRECPVFERGDLTITDKANFDDLINAIVKRHIKDIKIAYIDYAMYKKEVANDILPESHGVKLNLTLKKNKLKQLTNDFYNGIERDLCNGDETLLYKLLDEIIMECERDMVILSEYVNMGGTRNEKIKRLEEKYGENADKAMMIYRSVRSCFARHKVVK